MHVSVKLRTNIYHQNRHCWTGY